LSGFETFEVVYTAIQTLSHFLQKTILSGVEDIE